MYNRLWNYFRTADRSELLKVPGAKLALGVRCASPALTEIAPTIPRKKKCRVYSKLFDSEETVALNVDIGRYVLSVKNH